METRNIPTILVVFGATGDLMTKKIVPALYHLFAENNLPKLFYVVGFSRRNLETNSFRKHISDILLNYHKLKISQKDLNKFVNNFLYQQGNFHDDIYYRKLAHVLGRVDNEWKVCSNKLFYLAVPPKFNETIFKNLAASGLTIPCGPEEGWTRVIVEKPFGHDLETAEKLDNLLASLFKEEQIYPIDHYLAKDMLQNILSFRFSNNLLEESWSNKFIEKIEIRLLEKIGVEERGTFYEGLGSLRDVGQNHLLQMLALVTMDKPKSFTSEEVRKKRYEILKTLRIPTDEEIKKYTFRAQYKGYRKIKGVNTNSRTETYFKVKAYLNSARWEGVPVFIESGKRIKKQVKEIVVTFKHTVPCLCPPGQHFKNKVIFQVEPEEKIQIDFLSKKPGLKMQIGEKSLDFIYRKKEDKKQYVEEYEKLLLDCINGNQLLFVSTREIKAMWKYIDPIICAWDEDRVPLNFYKSDSDKIIQDAIYFFREKAKAKLKKEIVILGLGKMGGNLAKQLMEKNWRVFGYNRSPKDTKNLEKEGLIGIYDLKEIVSQLKSPRIIWLTLPAGKAIDEIIFNNGGLADLLGKDDVIIDGGNSYYKDSIRRTNKLAKKKIKFVDAGFSGGPAGARYGACLMVGGDRDTYEKLLPLYTDLAVSQGVRFFPGNGAGHFVKMVHNGIEYGMMQSIAEGFAILKKANYKLNLRDAVKVYNHGSVIESRLTGWLQDAFEIYGDDLNNISGSVKQTGEGKWTIKTAKKLKIKTKIIEEALKFRYESEKKPSYTGKILTALRNQFGGHDIK